ncbi:MAG TPA: NAD+ synthase [Euryarchaeota archaeon]|nr:NAD+ synthase [Euryarchaeota archaeon]
MNADYDEIKTVLTLFLKQTIERHGNAGYVLGLSGGLDSAVCLKLSVDAVGKERTLAVMMPTRETPEDDMNDAVEIVEQTGVEFLTIPLDGPRDSLSDILKLDDAMDRGNLASRLRMSTLFSIARMRNMLVLGTSNKSELLAGYFTKFGDGASDVSPLGDLYKTQVRILARKLDVPENIIQKIPRAGLVPNDSDESELGISYDDMDRVLTCLERRMSETGATEETGLPPNQILKVYSMVRTSIHKRRLGIIPKIGLRTVGTDWREI